ncbi:MAG: hypothetical protein ABIH49_02725 [archaeon]
MPGNIWRYPGDTVELERNPRNINGRQVLSLRHSNIFGEQREYIAFRGNELTYVGFEDEEGIGGVFFDPPVVIGDDRMSVGKSYTTHANFVMRDHPEMSGYIDETFSVVARENVRLYGETSGFGNCFKLREDFSGHSSGGPEGDVNDSGFAYHWYCPNVGQVQLEVDGQRVGLFGGNISTPQALNPGRVVYLSPVANKVVSMLRNRK